MGLNEARGAGKEPIEAIRKSLDRDIADRLDSGPIPLPRYAAGRLKAVAYRCPGHRRRRVHHHRLVKTRREGA